MRLVRHWFSSWFIVVLIPVIFCLCELDELSFWPAVLVLPWVAAIGMGLAAPMALAASFVVKTPPYDEI